MEEKNELNDIILNRGGGNAGMKKVMLAVASLAILLIIVVVIMSSLNSEGTSNLPQPIEPPNPSISASPIEEDPLFEPVSINETSSEEENLENVAQKIKAQSQAAQETELISAPEIIEEPTAVVVPAKYEKPIVKPAPKTTKPVSQPVAVKTAPIKPAVSGDYYLQVGSFGRFAPDAKFLKKITDAGYAYKLHEVEINGKKITKLLVGPYPTDKAARAELKSVRAKIEPGAFLSRI